jgi:hypothetical protein
MHIVPLLSNVVCGRVYFIDRLLPAVWNWNMQCQCPIHHEPCCSTWRKGVLTMQFRKYLFVFPLPCFFLRPIHYLGSLMAGASSGRTNTSCLVDPDLNRQTISLQMCGNGIVEKGEDCDPGKGMSSSCCDSSTCKFTSNAVCDPSSSSCCTDQCSFAPATQICRPSKDSKCDTAEMCTGNSSTCPADIVAPNGRLRNTYFSHYILTPRLLFRTKLWGWRSEVRKRAMHFC